MVRMLYQTGDVILNSVTSNKEPFYFQLEGLMRESSDKKVVIDAAHAGECHHQTLECIKKL